MYSLLRISLKAARVNAGLTQKESSEKFGVSQNLMIRWERDPSTMPAVYVRMIPEVYGLSVDHILFYPSIQA